MMSQTPDCLIPLETRNLDVNHPIWISRDHRRDFQVLVIFDTPKGWVF